MIRHALVGVAIGQQHQGGPVAVGGPVGLLDAAQEPTGEVGGAAGMDHGQRSTDGRAISKLDRRHRHRYLGVEHHEPEPVLGAQPRDERVDRLQRGHGWRSAHRPASVEDDLQAGGGPVRRVGARRRRLEQGVDRVLVLDHDQVVSSCRSVRMACESGPADWS